MPGVAAREAFRDELLNLLPQQLFTFVAKQFVHLGVHENDFSFSIHDYHGVRRRFQELVELRLGGSALGKLLLHLRRTRQR